MSIIEQQLAKERHDQGFSPPFSPSGASHPPGPARNVLLLRSIFTAESQLPDMVWLPFVAAESAFSGGPGSETGKCWSEGPNFPAADVCPI